MDKAEKTEVKITLYENGVVARSHNKKIGVLKRPLAEGYEIGFRRVLTEEEQKNADEIIKNMAVTESLKGKASNVCVFVTQEGLETLYHSIGVLLKKQSEDRWKAHLDQKQKELDDSDVEMHKVFCKEEEE